MPRTDNPEADAQVHIWELEKRPVEKVRCGYCCEEVPLNEAVITEWKGVFTGYSCGCDQID